MKGRMAFLVGPVLAVLLAVSSPVAPPTPGLASQNQHQGDQPSGARNAISAQAAPGLVRMESFRFT